MLTVLASTCIMYLDAWLWTVVSMTKQSNTQAKMGNHGEPGGLPKDFLTPWLLLLIRSLSMHGYQLMQTMTMLGLTAFDPTTVYRTLRRLEKEGLIISDWKTGEAGPAKRVYSLTEVGEELLGTWASALEQYQNVLNRFFDLYTEAKRTPGEEDASTSPSPK